MQLEESRRYKKCNLVGMRAALNTERIEASSQRPLRAVETILDAVCEFAERWRCKRYCSGYTAKMGVWNGVHVHHTTKKLNATSEMNTCDVGVVLGAVFYRAVVVG